MQLLGRLRFGWKLSKIACQRISTLLVLCNAPQAELVPIKFILDLHDVLNENDFNNALQEIVGDA